MTNELPGNDTLPLGCTLSDVSGKDTLPEDWHERREEIMAEQAAEQAQDDLFWKRFWRDSTTEDLGA